MGLKLYHCERARSMRPLWTLEEMGIDYELITMPFPPRYLHKEYLEKKNLLLDKIHLEEVLQKNENGGI